MEKVCKAGQHGESLSPKGEFEGGADNREVIMRAGGVRTKMHVGVVDEQVAIAKVDDGEVIGLPFDKMVGHREYAV